jgi:hypothetical protein
MRCILQQPHFFIIARFALFFGVFLRVEADKLFSRR